MTVNFDEVFDRVDQRRAFAQQQPVEPEIPAAEEEEESPNLLIDALRGVGNGVFNAVDNTVGITGIDLGLEDVFGETRTMVGGLAEGFTQFATGFVPVFGALGRVGALGAVGRGVAAGAVADFAVFDAQEERLSNLLVEVPALKNPVTEWLAADEDDGEFEGRLKNVFEGAALGLAFDGFMLGLRQLKAGRKAIAEGASPEEAAERVREVEAQKAEEPEAASTAPEAEESLTPAADDFSDFELPPIDADQVRQFITDTENRGLLNAVPGIDLNFATHPRSGDKATRELLGLDPDYYSTVEAAGDYGAEVVAFEIREQIMPGIRETLAADKAYVQGDVENIQKRMLDTATQYAKAIGESDAEKALSDMAALNKIALDAPEKMLEAEASMQAGMFAMKTIEKDTARYIERLRPKLRDGSISDTELQLFGEIVQVNKNFRTALVRGKSSGGRTLQSFKEQGEFIGGMEGEAVAAAQAKALAERGGREEQMTQARALLDLMDEQGPEALMEHLAKQEGKPFLNATLEYWMNSILSGLKTMTVNFMGNAATSLYLPLEGMVGAGARGQWDQMKVYAETYLDLISSTRDAWNYSKQSWGKFAGAEEGGNILLPDSRAFAEGEARKAISSEALGFRAESPLGRFLDSAGPKVRLPGRTLQATDEFFKQLNARAIVKRNLRKEGLDKGLQGPQLAEYVEGGVGKIIRDGEMFKAQDIYKKAKANVEAQMPASRDLFGTEEDIKDAIKEEFNRLWQSEGKFHQSVAEAATNYAEEVTFTKSLRPGSYAKGAQDFLVNHPEMRFVVPFVRTPVNILNFAFDRSPIAAANAAKDLVLSKAIGKEFPAISEAQRHLARDLGSSDPAVAAEATGRMIMATGSFFTILSATAAGTLTGRGPKSKDERRALEAAGWQPYSIRIGDTYVSYNRMDPFATMIGTIVDYREYGRWADTGDQTILEQQILAVVSSLAQNFTNKSYVSGIRSFVDLLTDPESNAATEAGRLGASFIPSLVGQNVGAVDPYAREMRTMLDSAYNRIPFLSDNLDPVRNILGEPVDRVRSIGGETIPLANAFLPIASRSTKDRKIATELASLAWPFSPPPK
jgi:hypothetical protein